MLLGGFVRLAPTCVVGGALALVEEAAPARSSSLFPSSAGAATAGGASGWFTVQPGATSPSGAPSAGGTARAGRSCRGDEQGEQPNDRAPEPRACLRRGAPAVLAIASLLGAAFTEQPNVFLLVSLLIGFSSVSVQILIPLAAHLAPAESRGRVVGRIMGGLLLGILLARPVSSVVADHFGWRAMFMAAAALMAFISVVLALTIPKRQPDHSALMAN